MITAVRSIAANSSGLVSSVLKVFAIIVWPAMVALVLLNSLVGCVLFV